MKRFLILTLGLLLGVSFQSHAATQTAQARIFCLSLRFQQATDGTGFTTLDLSSAGNFDAPNGELAPTFNNPNESFSFFRLYDTLFDEVLQEGEIDLTLPSLVDGNGNGFPDFFEVSQGVSNAGSSGTYASVVDSGTVRATWNRAAGSKDGTCVLRLTSGMFGMLGDFTHAFELLEYSGAVSYTPAATNVSTVLTLSQSGDPQNQLAGPALFLKSATNRFNELELQPGAWTNSAGQTLSFTSDFFERDPSMPTNYVGLVEFDDGDLGTSDVDYWAWVLSIDDPNDSNGNGVPDFSDDVGSTNAQPPLLTLTRGSTDLSLTISGTVGRTHEVQQINLVGQTNWATIKSITLTTGSQIVSLPLPTNGASFWRVHAL